MTPDEVAAENAAWRAYLSSARGKVLTTAFAHGWLAGRDYSARAAVERVAELRALVAEAIPYLEDLEDCGRRGEGWQSSELMDWVRRARLAATAPQQQEEAGGETGGRGEAAALAD